MKRPIGIFDSGVGGLTVASAIKQLLPQESFIYYGDTRHAPYGDKSQSTILEYSRRITSFLLEQDCKAVVIACNTASAMAFEDLQRLFPETLILNVVDPVVESLHSQDLRKVGVIATRATVHSQVYASRLLAINPSLKVVSKATPLLAPLVEEGFANTDISRGVLKKYLNDPVFEAIDALILGCTHYPLLQNDIKRFFKKKIEIIDSPGLVANGLRSMLELNALLNEEGAAKYHFYFSEKTPSFDQISTMFFGEALSLTEKVLRA